jgi:hypothetical protein
MAPGFADVSVNEVVLGHVLSLDKNSLVAELQNAHSEVWNNLNSTEKRAWGTLALALLKAKAATQRAGASAVGHGGGPRPRHHGSSAGAPAAAGAGDLAAPNLVRAAAPLPRRSSACQGGWGREASASNPMPHQVPQPLRPLLPPRPSPLRSSRGPRSALR